MRRRERLFLSGKGDGMADVVRTAPLAGSAAHGILFALAANFLFATSDMLVKLLTARYPVFQVIVMQAGFACIPLFIMLRRAGGLRHMRVRHPVRVALRGLFAGVGTIFGFFAFSQLPLADVYSIAFCVPIVVTLASIPLLREQVGGRRMLAVVTGFAGILIMVQPGGAALSLGHLAAFCSVFTSAGVILIMRSIGRKEERSVMVAAVLTGLLVVNLPGAVLFGHLPSWQDVGLAAASGLLMGTGQFASLEALRHAPIGSIAPMQYTMLIWALVYGLAVFGDPVKLNVLAGAGVVIASSLYIMHRERLRAREEARTAPAP